LSLFITMRLLVDSKTAEKLHDSIEDITPFRELSRFLQERCIEFHKKVSLVENRKSSTSVAHIKNGMKLMRLMESDEEVETDVPETDEEEEVAWQPKPIKRVSYEHADLDILAREIQPEVLAGNKAAWNKLYHAFHPYITAIAAHELYYYPEAIEDVVNEVFNWFHNHLQDWDEGTGLMTWLKRVTQNKAKNWDDREKKRKFVHVPIGDEYQGEDEEGDVEYARSGVTGLHPDVERDNPGYKREFDRTPDEQAAYSEETRELFKLIDRTIKKTLPADEAAVMSLILYNDTISEKEIAETLGWSISKVKSRKENGRWWMNKAVEADPALRRLVNIFRGAGKIRESKNSTVKALCEIFGKPFSPQFEAAMMLQERLSK